jgi:hypothetical protein
VKWYPFWCARFMLTLANPPLYVKHTGYADAFPFAGAFGLRRAPTKEGADSRSRSFVAESYFLFLRQEVLP